MIFFLWFENQLILIFPLKKFYNIDHRSKNFKPWPKCCKSGRKITRVQDLDGQLHVVKKSGYRHRLPLPLLLLLRQLLGQT